MTMETPPRPALRPRREDDLPIIAAWASDAEQAERWGGRSLTHPVTPEQLRARSGQPGHSAWVLSDFAIGPGTLPGRTASDHADGTAASGGGDIPIAQFELRTVDGTSRISRLIVDPARRGEGLGRLLIRHAIDIARQQGARRLELGVVPGNDIAIGLYRGCGFLPDGESGGFPRMTLALTRPLGEFSQDPQAVRRHGAPPSRSA